MHGLRPEYQDEVNFVILDYDIGEQRELAAQMAAARHPAFALIPPDSGPGAASELRFGPMNDEEMREYLDAAIAAYSS